jgi:exosortase A-associated hydrolase 1
MANGESIEWHERPLIFNCCGERLLGILHPSVEAADVLVIVIVGGHQYRIGSHRQFVEMARTLAKAGIPTLRFDHRGYGDSEGDLHRYWSIAPDIAAAIDAGIAASGVSGVVLWGLCDGASAISFYAPSDPRVVGIVLANPWVRSEATEPQAVLRSYYPNRLKQRDFWRDLLLGRIDLAKSAAWLARALMPTLRAQVQRFRQSEPTTLRDLPTAVLAGLTNFRGRVLLLLSEDDITAAEFRYVVSKRPWRGRLRRMESRIHTVNLKGADHTFSREGTKTQAEQSTIAWIRGNLYNASKN